MRHRTVAVLACAVLALAGLGRAVAQEGPPDGTPDIHGTWKGKAHAMEFHLGGTEKNGVSEPYPITVDVSQTGAAITLDVTISRDEGPLVYRLVGEIGRGRFWAQGMDVGGTGSALVTLGAVSAKGNAMKGTELLLFDPPLETKFTLKKHGAS
jgi:hypothetical protein